jgi:hypothetical protein
MRLVLYVLVCSVAPLLACNQDSYASNAERDTHMGRDFHASQEAPTEPSSSAATPAPAPSASH